MGEAVNCEVNGTGQKTFKKKKKQKKKKLTVIKKICFLGDDPKRNWSGKFINGHASSKTVIFKRFTVPNTSYSLVFFSSIGSILLLVLRQFKQDHNRVNKL